MSATTPASRACPAAGGSVPTVHPERGCAEPGGPDLQRPGPGGLGGSAGYSALGGPAHTGGAQFPAPPALLRPPATPRPRMHPNTAPAQLPPAAPPRPCKPQLVVSSLNNGDVTGAARLLATVFIQGGCALYFHGPHFGC